MADEPRPLIDAKTFQEPIWRLAETLSEKVRREGPGALRAAPYVADDLQMMIRQAIATYNLLFYLNADERREQDCYWNNSYGVVTAPLVRSMIDCLYNVTMILEDPAEYGPLYRKSGLKKRLLDIEEDQTIYAGKPEWDNYNAQQMKLIAGFIREDGFTVDEIRRAKGWKTLGAYLLEGKPEDATPHKVFLKRFTHMKWRQYSALSHCSFDGYLGEIPAGAYFVIDRFPHEQRPEFDKMYKAFVTLHIGRAATILLSLVTELQLFFKFDGADINNRIQKMWAALAGLFEANELYSKRYAELMKKRGISA